MAITTGAIKSMEVERWSKDVPRSGPISKFVPREGNVVGGRYQLIAEIGQGAMGCVWKATHVTLGRTFAVKFLKAYDTDGARREERFLREARLAASIAHRFVVDIVDFGTTDEGTPYLVMEYLHGEGLDRRLSREPPLPVRELMRLLAEVLLGLEAVHAAGVVHRDVKPENILLTQEADQMVPKLVDFGISREAPGEAAPRTTPLGGFGTVMGTPWYMSPEQASGRMPVDRRSDMFSVGVILYEALTGVPPFDGPNLESVVVAVARGESTPLIVMRGELDGDLCAIVDRALQRDPVRRYQRAESMAAALLAAMPRVPPDQLCVRPAVIASPAGPARTEATDALPRRSAPRSLLAPLRRPRSYAAGAGLLALAVAFVVAGQTRGRASAPPPPVQAAVSVPALPVEAPLLTARAPRPPEEEEVPSVERRPPPRPRPHRAARPTPPRTRPDFFRTPGF
jgi:serine/threonine protein kinase